MGVWLPLAMAETVSWLKVIVRMLGDKRTRQTLKVAPASEVLKSWCLPLMGAAFAEDEKRFEEQNRKTRHDSMMDDLMALAKEMGAKVEVNKHG